VAHIKRCPGTRFNAYNDFFSIRKNESKSLQTLTARIDDTMSKMQNLRPANFDLKQLDEELTCMAMIRALPEEYANFTSSILLLGTLSKSALQDAFYAEEMNCKHRVTESSNTNTKNALFTKAKTGTGNVTKTCKCNPSTACDFCEKAGHCVHECYTMIHAKKQGRKDKLQDILVKPKTNKMRTKG